MIRILITYLIPLLLPVLAWYLWTKFSPAKAKTPENLTGSAAAPWSKLGIAGVVLLALTLGSVALFSGAEPGNVYEPARMVDGEVVSGEQRVESSSAPTKLDN